nr:hypothetical protein BgiMline_026605 [Biomphalaria glabrata]
MSRALIYTSAPKQAMSRALIYTSAPKQAMSRALIYTSAPKQAMSRALFNKLSNGSPHTFWHAAHPQGYRQISPPSSSPDTTEELQFLNGLDKKCYKSVRNLDNVLVPLKKTGLT